MTEVSSLKNSSLSRMLTIFWITACSCCKNRSVTSRRADSRLNDSATRARSLLSVSKVACWLSRCLWRPAAVCFDDSAKAAYPSRSWLMLRIRSSLSWLMWPYRNNRSLRMFCWFWRMLIFRWSCWFVDQSIPQAVQIDGSICFYCQLGNIRVE